MCRRPIERGILLLTCLLEMTYLLSFHLHTFCMTSCRLIWDRKSIKHNILTTYFLQFLHTSLSASSAAATTSHIAVIPCSATNRCLPSKSSRKALFGTIFDLSHPRSKYRHYSHAVPQNHLSMHSTIYSLALQHFTLSQVIDCVLPVAAHVATTKGTLSDLL